MLERRVKLRIFGVGPVLHPVQGYSSLLELLFLDIVFRQRAADIVGSACFLQNIEQPVRFVPLGLIIHRPGYSGEKTQEVHQFRKEEVVYLAEERLGGCDLVKALDFSFVRLPERCG